MNSLVSGSKWCNCFINSDKLVSKHFVILQLTWMRNPTLSLSFTPYVTNSFQLSGKIMDIINFWSLHHWLHLKPKTHFGSQNLYTGYWRTTSSRAIFTQCLHHTFGNLFLHRREMRVWWFENALENCSLSVDMLMSMIRKKLKIKRKILPIGSLKFILSSYNDNIVMKICEVGWFENFSTFPISISK